MKLENIISNTSIISTENFSDRMIDMICIDSRKVVANSLFIAIRGNVVDGHAFIDKAVQMGAIAIVCEELPAVLNAKVSYILVENAARTAGEVSTAFYNFPSKHLKLIGVTGTNGKTSIATLLYQLFMKLGYKVGLLSTVRNYIDQSEIVATHTTPDCVSLNELLNKMVEAGCDYCFMEVSSHAIDQDRIAGLEFCGGLFSNITHDHLDYHKTFRNYIDTKKKFFDNLSPSAFALTNKDDKNGMVMVQNCSAKIKTYSLSSISDFKSQILENAFTGLVLKMDDVEVHTKLVGEFNAYNMLAVYGTAILLNQEKAEVLRAISTLESVEGRFNYTISDRDKIVGIVDYAHTPDALEKVLETINKSKTKSVQTISIVGCGGDRDAAKRPIMAGIACKLSDRVILTSDNPRSENPVDIIKEMQVGVEAEMKKKVLSIVDRREAIRTACTIAEKGDVILLAGKGHEHYQEIKGERFPFDDRKILMESFEEMGR